MTASLSKSRETCALTVGTDRWSSARDLGVAEPAADVEGDLPLAVGQPVEPASRPASRGVGPDGADRGMTVRVTDGESIGSPSATVRIAATISAGGVSLSRNPSAPAASAAEDVLVGVERGQHDDPRRVSAGRAARRVASSPLSTGIRMSISTTSGRARRPAGARRGRRLPRRRPARSCWPPSISASAERTSGSSSTIRTSSPFTRSYRHGIHPSEHERRPVATVLETAAVELGPLAQADQAEARRPARPGRRSRAGCASRTSTPSLGGPVT